MGRWALLAVLIGAVELLELHGPDGQMAFVAERAISSLRQPTEPDLLRHFPRRTRCVVTTTDGKFTATTETCAQIRDMLGDEKRPNPN